MHTVISVHASEIEPETLRALTAEYLSLERVRVFRQLLVRRLGVFALIPVVLGLMLHRLTASASLVSIAILMTPPIGAWVVELRRARRLDRRLDEIMR